MWPAAWPHRPSITTDQGKVGRTYLELENILDGIKLLLVPVNGRESRQLEWSKGGAGATMAHVASRQRNGRAFRSLLAAAA